MNKNKNHLQHITSDGFADDGAIQTHQPSGYGGVQPGVRNGCWSRRIYLQIKRQDIALFKLLLESYDNLAYMTVVDKWAAIVQLNFLTGDQERIKVFLHNMAQEIQLTKPDQPAKEEYA